MSNERTKNGGGLSVMDMVTVALLTAVLCVLAPWQITTGPISYTLATMVVVFVTMLVGWRKGLLVCLIYLLLGAVGVPVFSGMQGGLAKLTGSTGGYLGGYLALVLVGGLFHDLVAKRFYEKRIVYYIVTFVGFVIGTAALYALGTAYFMYISGYSLKASVAACITPFIPTDIAKTCVGIVLGDILRVRLVKAGILESFR